MACHPLQFNMFRAMQSYHIAGFRLGFALGCADALAALEAVKAPVDFNQYIGVCGSSISQQLAELWLAMGM
jgi:histidinol-phosphate/aromatic aminotransferase/cobyric acid decarboxylase-like protein